MNNSVEFIERACKLVDTQNTVSLNIANGIVVVKMNRYEYYHIQMPKQKDYCELLEHAAYLNKSGIIEVAHHVRLLLAHLYLAEVEND